MSAQILVLGVGNILLSDEGAGVRVVEELVRSQTLPCGVEAIDGGTMGLDLLPYLEGKSHLFIVDAVRSAAEPGTLLVEELADPPAYFRQKISPHQIGLAELLAVAALTGALPPSITLFGIVPLSLATGMELSAPVAAAVARAVPLLLERLADLGRPASQVPCQGFC
jgi:hydrogenase maturation protease